MNALHPGASAPGCTILTVSMNIRQKKENHSDEAGAISAQSFLWNKYVSNNDNSVSAPAGTDIQLAHYDYETHVSGVSGIKNGRLERTTYGNGEYVTYAYDRFDQVVRQDYNCGETNLFFYSTEGELTKKARVGRQLLRCLPCIIK